MSIAMDSIVRHYLIKGKALPYVARRVPNKAMLTGKELGNALRVAIEKKSALLESRGEGRLSKKAVADEFGVRPPSVQDWINYGRIGKRHLNRLVTFFADVAEPSHWGIDVSTEIDKTQLTAQPPANETPIYPDRSENPESIQIDVQQINQFVADLKKAFHEGRLTPRRFALLKGLLNEGTEIPARGMEHQQIATRGGDGRHKQQRRKAST